MEPLCLSVQCVKARDSHSAVHVGAIKSEQFLPSHYRSLYLMLFNTVVAGFETTLNYFLDNDTSRQFGCVSMDKKERMMVMMICRNG